MNYKLPNLPYEPTALAPFLSGETFEFHYGKHHKAYVDNMNKLLPGTGLESKKLDEIVKSASGGLFNNAAQAWNHTFYWLSMTADPGAPKKDGALMKAISKDFGSLDDLKTKFADAATTQFGSGWAWLVKDNSGKLDVRKTSNADVPFKDGSCVPLMTCDVWEHAYYIDYRNARAKYVDGFWQHLNWNFAEENFNRGGIVDLTDKMR